MRYQQAKHSTTTYFLALLAIVLFVTGCADTKELVYFNGATDKTLQTQQWNVEPVIQVNDLLSITVSSLNAEASNLFNAPNESTPNTNAATAGNNTLTIGYLVNTNGDILYPILGNVHAEGLKKSQLSEKLQKELRDRQLLKDPIVTVRHLNFRVSVLGEVNRPGVYTVQNEKVTLLEALGLAGDITIYGRKDNVMIVRDNPKGEKTIKRLNLNNQELFESEYYYLKSNDVVFVEPSKNKVVRERNMYMVPLVLSVVSLAFIVVNAIVINQ